MIGVPCSGKSTAARALRATTRSVVLDMDDEVLELHGGAWPSIEVKNEVVVPQVLDRVVTLDDVVLLNSYSQVPWTRRLRDAGFAVVLLDVSEEEQRRRDERRRAEEGWSNREWFGWHRDVIDEHRRLGLFDHVVDADAAADAVAAALAALLG